MRTTTLVHLEHQGSGHCGNDRIQVLSPVPVFSFRQHGRKRLSVMPMLRVAVRANDGVWEGVARASDLARAGLLGCVLRVGKFTFMDGVALDYWG